MNHFAQLHDFLLEYAQFYLGIVDFEVNKLTALLNNDLVQIENNILLQQAHLMKIESIERKRFAFTQSLGYENHSLNDIVQSFTGDEKEALLKIHHDLSAMIQDIKHYNQKSMELAQMNLTLFQSQMKPSTTESWSI